MNALNDVPEFYHKILSWVLHTKEKFPKRSRPIVVGINGPQGSGKSTLTSRLVELLSRKGVSAVTLSIDDFYLSRAEQLALANRYPNNPLLQQRGYPGTHDIVQGEKTLEALKNISKLKFVSCPVYDKSKFNGQGDRLTPDLWTQVHAPLDIVFLEGWMLGFSPVDFVKNPLSKAMGRTNDTSSSSASSSAVGVCSENNLHEVNLLLSDYAKWTNRLDAFLFLKPDDYRHVLTWRVEAEERMKALGKSGMTTAEITDYIQKFLVAYEIYLPHLEKHLPASTNSLVIEIGRDRRPTC